MAITDTGFDTDMSALLTEGGRPDITAANVTVASPSEITCTISLAQIEPGDPAAALTSA